MTGAAYRLVASESEWRAAREAIRGARRLAVDVEADGFHRYPERVALIQVAVEGGGIWLLDPLALADLDALGDALADARVPVVMHAASYDVRALDRDHGYAVRGLFDTAIGAQLVGARQTGLANVLEAFLDLRIAKPKRLQRTDWSKRPLGQAALDYAAADVAHLFALADEIDARLRALGRLDWAAEECRRLEAERYREPDPPEEAFLGVSGARALTDRQRAVLRSVYLFRDAEARRLGRPPYRIMPERTVIALAQSDDLDLDDVGGIDRRLLTSGRQRLEAAIERGRTAPPVPWPRSPRRRPWPREAQLRLRRLKAWRTGEAERLDLDPGILWPMDHLKQVALHPGVPTADLDPECDPPCVREWQWRALGPSLARFRRDVLGDGPEPARGA